MMATNWRVDETKILSKQEVRAVVDDLKRRGRRSVNTRQNLAIFRLATCCGLRVSEIGGLTLADLKLAVSRPYIRLRKDITKRHVPRTFPLWKLPSVLADLAAWKIERQRQGAKAGDPFVCTQTKANRRKVTRTMRGPAIAWKDKIIKTGKRKGEVVQEAAKYGTAERRMVICRGRGKALGRGAIRMRFIRACRVLGTERQATLTIHHGRHTAASHLLAGGWSLPAVRDALGHTNIATTSVYSHIGVDEDEAVQDVFDF